MRARRRSCAPSPTCGAAVAASPSCRAWRTATGLRGAPSELGVEAVEGEQLDRLRIVARSQLDLVAARPQDLDQRPEDQHVGRGRHVDPDPHAAIAVRRAACSCQSAKQRRPQSWRERSWRPLTWSSSSRATVSGSEEALLAQRAVERISRATGSSSPRSHAAAGIEKPALLAVDDRAGQERRDGPPQQPLLREPADLHARGERQRELGDHGVEVGHPRLERVRHARAVGLHEQVVDEVDAEVDVLKAGQLLGARRLVVARAQDADRIPGARRAGGRRAPRGRRREKISFQPWWRSSGGRCAARTKRLAL